MQSFFHFPLPLTKVDIQFGYVRMPYSISWILVILHLLDNINIIFGTKIYRQIIGIPMGTNRAPLVADVFYTAAKEILWIHLTMTIKFINSTSRYLDDFLNIVNPYFEGIVNQIYPAELRLNKANNTPKQMD